MQIDGFNWDSSNWPKCGKHGLSREEIEQLFLENQVKVAPDLKHSTPTEDRYIAVGYVNNRAVFVAFTFRNNLIRPISARYMHTEEVKNYEAST